ncbi:unnamed protein product [Urochloa decumbens]|uniref:Uncharacterized protein n=1 Tax=Urochloa decumbens TaxID=240449 RepID=A0ABC8YY23_9POAL
MADEAEKMTDKQPAAGLLLVLVKEEEQARAEQSVSLWALLNAFIVAVSLAVIYATPALLSWLFGAPYEATGTDMLGSALELELGYISCSALQAAPAALALLLAGGHRRRKIRRALAYVALAVCVAGHCMFASELGGIILADDPAAGPPRGLFLRICYAVDIFAFAAVDLLCFLALLRREGSRVRNKDY